MRQGVIIAAAILAGCAKLDLPPEQGSTCGSNLVVDGSQAFDLDVGTGDVCMQLDATHNAQPAHLQISIEGAGFKSSLVDIDELPLKDGSDVVVGERTFHNLDWSLEAGELRDVILHVKGHGPAHLSISLN